MPRRSRKTPCSDQLLMSTNREKPQQRNAANARERARMRVLSRAFCRLKTTLPWVPADTKLSKLDTLRLASSYISHLKGILRDGSSDSQQEEPIHPAITLTWPFGFNRGGGSGGGGGSGSDDADSGSECSWEDGGKEIMTSSNACIHLDSSSKNLENQHPYQHYQHAPLHHLPFN